LRTARILFAPIVKTLTSFLSQLPFTHHPTQNFWWSKRFRAKLAVQVLRNVQTHVEPDQIGQLQRAHGVVITKFHSSVDVLHAGHALFKHSHRFKTERDTQTTGRKTRNILHHDRLFPHFLADAFDCADRLRARLLSYYDFNQSHDVDRVEKVHTNNRISAFGSTGYLC